jgi:tripartite ATP-independent transporter DctM subunit
MSGAEIGLLSVFFVLILVYAGVHVGVALGVLSFFCIWMIRGDPITAGRMLALAAAESLAQYEFGVVPLFVLMGLFVSISDLGKDTYEVANQLLRRVKGGLGTATVAANAVFAAITGTSIASASVFTKIAVPEMLRHGYNPRFAVGVVAGSSVLGMLIPPSVLLIIFGILSETSIGHLFIAGIVPGVILSVAYAILIWVMANRYPKSVMVDGVFAQRSMELMSTGEMFIKAAPIVLLIIAVLGGIYGGVFTATEAGAIGAFGAMLIAFARRRLTPSVFWQILVEAGQITASLSFLLISAHLYTRMIAITGIPNAMEAYIQILGLGFWEIMAIYVVLLIVLGTIIDAGSIMLILVPLVLPVFMLYDANLIWLGIVTVIGVEIGLLTPPFGLAVFVVHATLSETRISVNDIFVGVLPFAATMALVLLLMLAFPQLSLILL